MQRRNADSPKEQRDAPSPRPSAKRGLKTRTKGEDRVREILEVSQKLFLSHGVENVSTRMIATSIGISQPALYKHFATKQEILDLLVDQAFGELERALQALEPTGVKWIEEAIAEYIRFGLEHPDEYRLALIVFRPYRPPHNHSPERRQAVQATRRASYRLLESHVRAGMEAGEIRSDFGSAPAVAQCLWAGMHGLVSLLITRTQFPWEDWETLIALQTRVLLGGLRAPQRKP